VGSGGFCGLSTFVAPYLVMVYVDQRSLTSTYSSLDWCSADLMTFDSICIGVRTILGVGTRTRLSLLFSYFSLINSPWADG